MAGQGQIVIKQALPSPEERTNPVWDEREVSFMMRVKHPQLVKFLGAGEITDKHSGQPLLFMVQAAYIYQTHIRESACNSHYMNPEGIHERWQH